MITADQKLAGSWKGEAVVEVLDGVVEIKEAFKEGAAFIFGLFGFEFGEGALLDVS